MTSVIVIIAATLLFALSVKSQAINPSILQDSRDLPKTDGRFGFLYRTEDGIAHAAKSEGDGIVHGRYTYSDPTGFKLNFNYNAGTKVTPGYNYDDQRSAPVYEQQQQQPIKQRIQSSNDYYTNQQDQQPIRRIRPPASLRNDVNYNNDYTNYQ